MFKPLLACNADLSKVRYPVYVSPKLDGIRCIVINGIAMSRSMKPIPNRYIQSQISEYANNPTRLKAMGFVMSAVKWFTDTPRKVSLL